jgi:hypothetical protein
MYNKNAKIRTEPEIPVLTTLRPLNFKLKSWSCSIVKLVLICHSIFLPCERVGCQ